MRVLISLSLVFSAAALASPEFPGLIQTKYSTAVAPPCSLCHVGPTGVGTVNSRFGTAMRGKGLISGDGASLDAALAALENAMTDSDGDGVTDIDELKAGTDPNTVPGTTGGGAGGGGGNGPVAALKYGCGATIAPELFFALALVPMLKRRRRS